jgi:hypothetical protein
VKNAVPAAVPDAIPMHKALDRCEPLQRLRERIAGSNARLSAARSALPPALRASVQAGPLDHEGWTLLASTPATAAKIRQLLPRIEDIFQIQGFERTPIRVRVQSRSPR